MKLARKNPTQTNSWQKLKTHFEQIKEVHLNELFAQDSKRVSQMSIAWGDFLVDFSKNRWTQETIDLFSELANELCLKETIELYFKENDLNFTEKRAVLHTALRSEEEEILLRGRNIVDDINDVKNKLQQFSDSVINGKKVGYTGKAFTDVVSIGIGGSSLGPKLVCNALKHYKNHLNIHFVSNIDGDHLHETLKELNVETTLFIVVSKSFTTAETLKNANTVKEWFLQEAPKNALEEHFVAVSANLGKVKEFGIKEDNLFPMWDWVGGRFSLWSAVGLPIVLSIGYKNFEKLLKGAQKADRHLLEEEFSKNIPVLMAFLSVWYNNFYEIQQEAIIPYSHYLNDFVPFMQQGFMESNGKSIDRNGEKINYQTGNVIFGGVGCNAQHAFMQLFHQGTKLIPTDLVGFSKSLHKNKEHHNILMGNMFAQANALAFGTKGKKINNVFKVFEGNKPTSTFLINELTPETLGELIALYEHKIFIQGILWNINSFDQFGVELGKELSKRIIKSLEEENSSEVVSPLMSFYSENK